jgi:hypothetical protein
VFWKTVEAPESPEEDGGDRYPHTDIAGFHGLTGKRLSSISAAELPGGGELRLDFESGKVVILRNVNDCSKLVIEPHDQRAR